MGEIAEMMLDGTLCQVCGGLMDDISENHDLEPPGHPRTCGGCDDDKPRRKRRGKKKKGGA